MTCIREESFPDMFKNLGNEKRLSELRARFPDKSHCFLLKKSATACIDLPQDFGSVLAGSICPNNPYEARAEEIAKRESYSWLVGSAQGCHRELKTRGTLQEDASSVEYTLASIFGEYLDARRAF